MHAIQAMAGLAQHWKLEDVALVLLLQFHCYLRTGEVTSMLLSQFSFGRNSVLTIMLPNTKGTNRGGSVESVTVEDPALVVSLRLFAEKHAYHGTPFCAAQSHSSGKCLRIC